jgi:hypothetical protein
MAIFCVFDANGFAGLPIVIPFTFISFPKVTVFVNVFAPANVCVAVVTTPPKLASAGVNINSDVPLITAPFALEVPEISPIILIPAFAAVIDAFTYSVVAILVELSLVAGVGAVGTPVNAGDARGALKRMSAVLVEILFVFVVILAVFEVILVSNALSAFVALVVSLLILVVFAVMLAVFVLIEVGKVAMVAELTPPTLFTVVAKLPLPDPVISPVKVVIAFAAITFVPITKPKFVLASAAVVAPVPPLAIAIDPFILAEVKLLSATPAFALCRST